MKNILLTLSFIFSFLFSQAQFVFDPFDFKLNDTTLAIKPDSIAFAEPLTAMFDNTYVWFGLFPNTNTAVKMVVEHDLLYLNSESAIDDNNKVYVPVSNQDSLIYFRIRIIENGKVVKEHDGSEMMSVVEESTRYKQMAVEGLKKGQMLEKLIITLHNYSDSGWMTIQKSYPVRKSLFTLRCPATVQFVLKMYPNNITFNDTVLNNTDRYQFTNIGKIEPIIDESYSMTQSQKTRIEFALSQNFSTNKKFNSWAEKGRNRLEFLMTTEKSEIKYISKLIKNQGWDKLSGKEQLFAVENYLKNTINISKDYPYMEDVEKMFKAKYGDEYSILRVYIMIYQELGIPWEIAYSVVRSKKKFDADFPSPSFIEDPLFYFPSYKLFTDPVDRALRVGEISSLYLGQKAMFVKPILLGDQWSGVTRIDKIPVNKTEDVSRDYKINVTWDAENKMTVHTTYHGNSYADDGRKILYTIAGEEKAKEVIEEQIRNERKEGVFKIVSSENHNVNDFKEYYLPFVLSYQWETEEYIEQNGENLLVKYGELIGPQVQMYDKLERQNIIQSYYPHIHTSEVRIAIPEGYTAQGFENKNRQLAFKDQDGNDLFGIDIKVELLGNEIVMKIREYYSKIEYPVSDYMNFREVINAAADINKYTLLLKKK